MFNDFWRGSGPGPRFAKPSLAALALLCLCPGQAAADGPPVVVETATTQPITETLRVSGTVTSRRAGVLSAAVGGLVAVLDVDAGDRVETGQVLVGLDDELARLNVQRAEAAQAQVQSALADAQRRLGEAERLRDERGIAETEVRSLRAEVDMDEAALAAARAGLAEQRALLDRHTVRAPFAGVVAERMSELGEWVSPGDSLLSLVATDALRFDFRVPQSRFSSITRGTPVRVSLDAEPGEAWPGTIQAIVPVNDPAARTFLLRVEAPAAPAVPGMSARAAISIDTGRRAVVVSRDALIRHPDGRSTVWVVEGEGSGARVSERTVETGLEFGGLVELSSGLEAGAPVVVRGNESLQDGQAVTVRRNAPGPDSDSGSG
ncbi:MAG: efflux RND transporter periplasmic adaptor subunit [Xanthomonadales bacterium]|jgi:RND family efflux transporter MFP subunit|nr:efflux RND transporter periplasmic adaptor subunit [Xanthomonadales bacterium]